MSNRWLFNSGRRWYTHLLDNDKGKGLLSDHPMNSLSGKIILCYENFRNIRYFSTFETFLDFVILFLNRPLDDRYFHEVIIGDLPLKLYFDIDIDLVKIAITNFNEKLLISELTRSVLAYFLTDGVKLSLNRDFIWLTSHGETKKSYHLIVDNYFFFNMREVAFAVDQIKALLNSEVQSYFDWGVYTSKKNFRTLGSYKRGTSRVFTFLEEWPIEDMKIEYQYNEEIESDRRKTLLQFEASLITNVGHCSPMTPKVFDAKRIDSLGIIGDLEETIIDSAMDLLAKSAEVPKANLPFKITKSFGNFIILERKEATLCRICDTVHEHENPYLRVKDTDTYTEVTYFCRRAGKKGYSLGIIPKDVVTNTVSKEEISIAISSVNGLLGGRNVALAKKGSTEQRSRSSNYNIKKCLE